MCVYIYIFIIYSCIMCFFLMFFVYCIHYIKLLEYMIWYDIIFNRLLESDVQKLQTRHLLTPSQKGGLSSFLDELFGRWTVWFCWNFRNRDLINVKMWMLRTISRAHRDHTAPKFELKLPEIVRFHQSWDSNRKNIWMCIEFDVETHRMKR